MYLNQTANDYEAFHRLDSPPRDRPWSNKGRNPNVIAPWGNGQKILGNMLPLCNSNQQTKITQQTTRQPQQQQKETHNFIQSPQKRKRNRSDLGKFQKTNKNHKFNQIHLNMSKIQFKQYQQNLTIENDNQKLFKTNKKINVKDFSSIDNNFFIKSYFFPNNLKSNNRKEENQSLDNTRKRKEYQKLKDIQAPTFLAIKSVDLKEKFLMEDNQSDEMNANPLRSQRFYSTYRTISVLSSRKKSRRKMNKSVNENYQLKNSDEQFKTYNHKTIPSTKQSLKEINGSLRQRYKLMIEQKAKRDKLSESNEIIFTNSSLIKRNHDENFHSEETKITEQKQQTTNKSKKVSLSKERNTRISRLRKLKSKSDHENLMESLTPLLQPKTISLLKDNKQKSFRLK